MLGFWCLRLDAINSVFGFCPCVFACVSLLCAFVLRVSVACVSVGLFACLPCGCMLVYMLTFAVFGVFGHMCLFVVMCLCGFVFS